MDTGQSPYLGGWFQIFFIFTPTWEMMEFDYIICFQMGGLKSPTRYVFLGSTSSNGWFSIVMFVFRSVIFISKVCILNGWQLSLQVLQHPVPVFMLAWLTKLEIGQVWNVRQTFLQIERVQSEFFVGRKLKGVYSSLCHLVWKDIGLHWCLCWARFMEGMLVALQDADCGVGSNFQGFLWFFLLSFWSDYGDHMVGTNSSGGFLRPFLDSIKPFISIFVQTKFT